MSKYTTPAERIAELVSMDRIGLRQMPSGSPIPICTASSMGRRKRATVC